MTQEEALAKAKRECLILKEFLTDDEIKSHLSDVLGTETDYTSLMVNQAVVKMLKAILPVAPVSYSRGNISITRANIENVLKEFENKLIGSVNLYRGEPE
ncbi:MAG: hypothetical protein GX452_04425 [Ignavibacteriales bacterium]|nr:hypothetical protein [Ignavibacteriales bacterium]